MPEIGFANPRWRSRWGAARGQVAVWHLIAFCEVYDVVGHLIVSAPRHISEVVVDNNQRTIAILLEDSDNPQLKGGTGGDARYILDGVTIEKVHNNVIFVTKLWTL